MGYCPHRPGGRSERALRSAAAEYVVLEAQVAAGGERDESPGALLLVG
jgi:hypothetical protein